MAQPEVAIFDWNPGKRLLGAPLKKSLLPTQPARFVDLTGNLNALARQQLERRHADRARAQPERDRAGRALGILQLWMEATSPRPSNRLVDRGGGRFGFRVTQRQKPEEAADVSLQVCAHVDLWVEQLLSVERVTARMRSDLVSAARFARTAGPYTAIPIEERMLGKPLMMPQALDLSPTMAGELGRIVEFRYHGGLPVESLSIMSFVRI